MNTLVGLLAVLAAWWLWRKMRAGKSAKSAPESACPRHPLTGKPMEVERLPDTPRTKPTQLSFMQQDVLHCASQGLLIVPVSGDDASRVQGDQHYFYVRRTVAGLVRNGFLSYTPNGYEITDSGRGALATLPQRGNR